MYTAPGLKCALQARLQTHKHTLFALCADALAEAFTAALPASPLTWRAHAAAAGDAQYGHMQPAAQHLVQSIRAHQCAGAEPCAAFAAWLAAVLPPAPAPLLHAALQAGLVEAVLEARSLQTEGQACCLHITAPACLRLTLHGTGISASRD